MEKKSKIFNIIYIISFVILNLVNCMLLTVPNVIENIIPYKVNAFMVISSIVGNTSCLLVLLGLGFLIFKRKKTLYSFLLTFTSIISLLLFILSISCNYYGMMFCFDNLANLNLKNSGDSAYFLFDTLPNFIKFCIPAFFITAVMMLVAYIIFCQEVKKERFIDVKGPRKIKLGLIILLIGLFSLIGVNVAVDKTSEDTWYEYNTTPLYSVQSKGLLNHIVNETGDVFFGNTYLDETDRSKALAQIEQLKADPDGVNEFSNMFQGKNLLLIQLESFNNFLVGLEVEIDGEFVEVTPNINELVRNNIYFSNLYSSTGIGNTSDAEFTAMTGLYPTGKSYAIYKYNDHTYQTLPDMFKDKGYYTFSTHANDSIFYVRNETHTGMYDFNDHFGGESLTITEENTVHRWIGDVDLLKQTIDIMDNTEGNSFAYAICITNHTPFTMPLNGKEDKWFKCKENLLPLDYELSEDNRYNKIFTGYLEYAAYTDYAIGETIKYLKEKGMYEDTVVMMYGDHGIDTTIYNMFYEYRDKFNNDINEIIVDGHKNQKLLEYQLLNEVPLIIAHPDLNQKTVSLVRANTTIQPTICNLFGLEQEYYFDVDGLSSKQSLAFNSKTENIFYDGVVLSGTSQKYVITDSSYVNINDKLIEDYRTLRDLNDKILIYDLLNKDSKEGQ